MAQADRARTESQARRAGERLQALQREADRLATEERTLLGDLRKLEVDRELKAEQLKQIESETASVRQEVVAADARIRVLDEQDQAARPDLRARMVELYKLGRARYARLLLSTADVRRIGQASRTVAALAVIDRERFASHQRTLAELKTTRAALAARQNRLDVLRAQAVAARSAAERAARTQLELIADIDRRRDLNAQLSGELQSVQQRLQTTLRDLAAGRPAGEPASLPFNAFRGDLDWPVPGTVRRRMTANAKGIEVTALEGAAVNAVHEGVVAFADTFPGYGNLVILDHGGQIFTLYGDLQEISVTKGDRVDRGHSVGTVGTPPTSPGQPSLYFEVRIDGKPVDPLQWLRKR